MSYNVRIALTLMAFTTFASVAKPDTRDQEVGFDRTIVMGARADASPFISRDELSGEYRGFFWDICVAALVRSRYQFRTEEISVRQRSELLKNGSYCDDDQAEDRESPWNYGESCSGPIKSVDLLCDPTTVNLKRMTDFAKVSIEAEGGLPNHFVFSPILYLANGSYVHREGTRKQFREQIAKKLEPMCEEFPALKPVFCTNPPAHTAWSWIRRRDDSIFAAKPVDWDDACKAIEGGLKAEVDGFKSVTNRQPSAWPPQIWPEPKPEKPEFEIWGFLDGSTIGQSVIEAARLAPSSVGIGVCTQTFDTHTEAADAFCNGRIYRYFGDIDLVRAAVDAYRNSNSNNDCPLGENTPSEGTYEPYAMVLSNRIKGFPEDFTLALYSMFTDGTVAQMFDGRFGEGRRSQYLETLFRINSIPVGKLVSDEKN